MDHLTILYGQPPFGLVDISAKAQQVSPLLPGGTALEEMADGDVTSAIIYAPASTIERRYVLAQVLRTLTVGAPLTALARSDKGGTRIAADLKHFGCEVTDDARKHHRIVSTTRPVQLRAINEALVAGSLRQHNAHGLYTQPGVFSWDRIDAGSALLLKHLPLLRGIGADFGCGIGVLARTVLQSAAVTTLTLLDIDRRALAAAQKNIADVRATYMWADVRVASLPPASLDFVVMNPPFHDTGIEDQSLGQAFIAQAAAVLKPGGHLWLTANRHLPYEAHLAKLFSCTTRVDDADGFKIIHGQK